MVSLCNIGSNRAAKKFGTIPENWPQSAEIKIFAKMSKIAILRERLVFKNLDLLHENGSNSVIFGRIHLISFSYGH